MAVNFGPTGSLSGAHANLELKGKELSLICADRSVTQGLAPSKWDFSGSQMTERLGGVHMIELSKEFAEVER